MKTLYPVFLFYLRKIREKKRNPVFLIMGVMMPTLYLFLFSPLLSPLAGRMGYPTDHVLDVFVPGMLTLIAFSGGLFSGFGVIDEWRSGIIDRFRVTPVSRLSLFAGSVLQDLTAMIFQVFLFLLLALPMGFRIHPLHFLLLLVLLSLLLITTSTLGHALGLLTKSEDKFAPLIHGCNLPLLLLSGTFLPMTFAPPWLQFLAHLNPLYYAVEGARSLALGQMAAPTVWVAFVVLFPVTLVAIFWSSRVYTRTT